MRLFGRAGLLLLCVYVLTLAAHAQRLPVYATGLKDSLNNPLTSQICWQPVGPPDPVSGRAGAPISFADGSGEGYTTSAKVCYPVAAGAFGPVSVPDTAVASVRNACFHVTAADPNTPGLNVIDDPCVQPSSAAFARYWCPGAAAGCDFDRFHSPFVPNVKEATAGPPGPTGLQGLQGLPGNAGSLATPSVAGVVYLPPGGTNPTLAPVAGSGAGSDLLGAARGSGAALGVSADGATGANNGMQESFYFDGASAPSTLPPGFTYSSGTFNFFENAVGPASNGGDPFALIHPLQLAGGPFFPQATQYGLQFQAYYAGGGNTQAGSVGFNASVQDTDSGGPALDAVVGGGGFGINTGGTINYVLPYTGNNSPVANSTDSGAGGTWAAPTGGLYDVSLLVPGDGSVILSAMHAGVIGLSAAFRMPVTLPACASPCGPVGSTAGIQNMEVHGGAVLDRLGPFAEMDGASRAVSYLIPHRSGYHNLGLMLPFALTASGSEGKYDGSCPTTLSQIPASANGNQGQAVTASGCYKVFAYVPPGYDPHGDNKWVIVTHGYGTDGLLSLYTTFESGSDVADALYQAGYTVVILDNTVQNCYGNAQCVADIANVIAKMHAVLSLAPQPYLAGDSMGCLQILNAVAQGVVSPPAMIGYSCSTSLASLHNDSRGDEGNLMPDFGYTASAQYAAATAGYDPLLTSQTPGLMQSRLAAVPTLMIGDNADPTVNTAANSVAYVQAIDAVRPGDALFNQINGSVHVDPAQFNGPQAVAFFNQF